MNITTPTTPPAPPSIGGHGGESIRFEIHFAFPALTRLVEIYGSDHCFFFHALGGALEMILRGAGILRPTAEGPEFVVFGNLQEGTLSFCASERELAIRLTKELLTAASLPKEFFEIAWYDTDEDDFRLVHSTTPDLPFARWYEPDRRQQRLEITQSFTRLCSSLLNDFGQP